MEDLAGPAGRRERSSLVKWLLAGVLLANAFVIGLAAVVAYRGLQQTRGRAMLEVGNLSSVIEENLRGFVRTIDLTLQTVADEVERQRRAGRPDAAALEALLARQAARLPEVQSLQVEMHGPVPGPAGGLSVSRSGPVDMVGGRNVEFRRPIVGSDGRVAGMVRLRVGGSHFQALFSSIDLGKRGEMTLWADDLGPVAGYPAAIGNEDAGDMAVLRSELAAMIASGAHRLVLRSLAHVDGVARMHVLRKVDGYPLYLAVGVAERDFLGAWIREARGLAVVALSFLLVTAAGTWMVNRGWSHRAAADRALAEETARRQAAELRQAEEVAATAEAASRAKSELLAIVSHEIRTPAHGVVGMSELLMFTPLSAEQQGYVHTIRQCSESLVSLINDTLDFAKIEAGHLELEADSCDLARLVESAVAIVVQRAADKGLAMHLSIGATVPPIVVADGARLRQVLVNLLSNAVKFTDRGRVCLEVEAREGGLVRFAVQDTGVGIPVAVMPNLFRPFSQADRSISRRFGGTGLGLAICKRLVEAMGGEMGVTSREGFGSTFYFSLPLPEGVEVVGPPEAVAAGRRLDVLLVEDNPVNRQVATAMLKRDGHSVVVAEDGLVALERLACHRFDVVLMDIHMPRMDGIEATRLIRASPDPVTAAVPVVAVTADSLTEGSRRWQEAGMDGFITKPFTIAKLQEALCEVDGGERPADEEELARVLASLPAEEAARLAGGLRANAVELLARTVAAWRDGRVAEASADLHQIAGMSGLFALGDVEFLARQAMADMAAGDSGRVDAALAALDLAVGRAVVAVEATMARSTAPV